MGAARRDAADGAQGGGSDAWLGGVRGSGGEAGDARGAEGEATGDDHNLAAPSGLPLPEVTTVQTMPTLAWRCFSHPGSQDWQLIASLGAKMRILQVCRRNIFQIRNLGYTEISSNTLS